MWAFGTSQPGTVTGQDDFTFLGKDAVFKGVLTLEGNIRVDGRLEGELRSTGTLIVGGARGHQGQHHGRNPDHER
jgi:cytoskeletal protein CcmA (bactofilin family)